MAKADLLNIIYSKNKSPLEFKFDSMWLPSLYNYLTPQDVKDLHYIASSVKYSSKIDLKYKAIDDILRRRGFRKFHCGTNRIVYSYLEDQSFLIKVALDSVGLSDNPAEYKNQFILKPFVTKVFEVSQCGTVATVERVEPITSKQEFSSIGADIFELINTCIIGKYVLEDIGTKYFMNWGLRKGFGAVLLDYTYVYELDGNKLFCNKPDLITGELCGALIDYDDGFNNLICSKCGKRYFAQQLQDSVKEKMIIVKEEGEIDMKVSLKRGRNTISIFNTIDESEVIERKTKDISAQMNVHLSNNTDSTIADEIQAKNDIPNMNVRISNKQQPQVKEQPKASYKNVEVNSVVTPTPVTPPDVTETINIERVEKKEILTEDKNVVTTIKIESTLKTSEQMDFSKFGLDESDFEEPKDEEPKDGVEDKYEKEYGEEQENFERIKKGSNKKNILDNY